jgi:hypothetical protein
MAKLIVTRTRQFADMLRNYRILIGGERAATVAPAKTVEIELAPGAHQVTARLDFLSSPPLDIELGPTEVRRLMVGSNLGRSSRMKLAMALATIGPTAISLLAFACGSLFRDPYERTWFTQFIAPMVVLPPLLLLASMGLWRDHFLYIEETRNPGPDFRRVAIPQEPPLPVRITIRGMMIAVAILALLLGTMTEWGRYTRRDFYRGRAVFHGQMEASFRWIEKDYLRTATVFDKTGLNAHAGPVRRYAARAAAKADYHAEMKSKYDKAAASRRLAVEPDPPEPPWP